MTDDGFVGIEGRRLVEDVLRSGLDVGAVLLSQSAAAHLERLRQWVPSSARLFLTADRLFAGVADTQTPQGVAALVRPRQWQFDDLVGGLPLVVVLVEIQDPGNAGTILRSAEAFGATGALIARGTANPLTPKVLRASAGSALRFPVTPAPALPVAMAQLRVAGLKLYGASPRGTLRPSEADLRSPAALLIGNEGTGLPAEVERSVDALLQIPIEAPVESLNAAVAASILLYEASRQRSPGE
jgi:TrmH family RNA methyltransferase